MPTRMEKLQQKIIVAKNRLRDLEERHPKVFEKWQHYKDEIEGVTEQIKIEARKKAREGETFSLVDSADLSIIVVGKRRPIIYDYNAMRDLLVENGLEIADVLKKTVDVELVDKLCRANPELEPEIVKLKEYGELPTPAVTVKLP